jgi:nicotinamidase-related amidase
MILDSMNEEHASMLTLENTVLVVVDVQGKLAHLMHEKERFFDNLQKIIRGAQVLEVPIIVTEQIPEKLGSTIPEIAEFLSNVQPIKKISFSCGGSDEFMKALEATDRKQVLLTGMETHVCVYQTAMDLLRSGYEVHIVADAVSSRAAENKAVGLEKIKSAGAVLTSIEMALFELLKVAEGAKFKEIIKIIK